ncbi:hypothetical protein RRG08_013884 [Elysia crispata]|uniref:Uncharacterized protein n=1 Tax=Elysia crispata TaxID=231223 RepID=A0AAE1D1D6_9GAST|nr:hypothetical protein RRG08_013884 [Elysia crispata]
MAPYKSRRLMGGLRPQGFPDIQASCESKVWDFCGWRCEFFTFWVPVPRRLPRRTVIFHTFQVVIEVYGTVRSANNTAVYCVPEPSVPLTTRLFTVSIRTVRSANNTAVYCVPEPSVPLTTRLFTVSQNRPFR